MSCIFNINLISTFNLLIYVSNDSFSLQRYEQSNLRSQDIVKHTGFFILNSRLESQESEL